VTVVNLDEMRKRKEGLTVQELCEQLMDNHEKIDTLAIVFRNKDGEIESSWTIAERQTDIIGMFEVAKGTVINDMFQEYED
jgi:2-hydroxy-3-keto-5-methylthiopentenyl-1-phosphate phosphatase